MKGNNRKLSPGMAADLRRLRRAWDVLHATEQRMLGYRDAPTDRAADVIQLLRANQNVRAAARTRIEGEHHE